MKSYKFYITAWIRSTPYGSYYNVWYYSLHSVKRIKDLNWYSFISYSKPINTETEYSKWDYEYKLVIPILINTSDKSSWVIQRLVRDRIKEWGKKYGFDLRIIKGVKGYTFYDDVWLHPQLGV